MKRIILNWLLFFKIFRFLSRLFRYIEVYGYREGFELEYVRWGFRRKCFVYRVGVYTGWCVLLFWYIRRRGVDL